MYLQQKELTHLDPTILLLIDSTIILLTADIDTAALLKNKDKRNIKYDDKVFIYYDEKHTRGIDVKSQPLIMKGLVTVGPSNNLTNISQGIYRIRKLNFGHSIDFYMLNNI